MPERSDRPATKRTELVLWADREVRWQSSNDPEQNGHDHVQSGGGKDERPGSGDPSGFVYQIAERERERVDQCATVHGYSGYLDNPQARDVSHHLCADIRGTQNDDDGGVAAQERRSVRLNGRSLRRLRKELRRSLGHWLSPLSESFSGLAIRRRRSETIGASAGLRCSIPRGPHDHRDEAEQRRRHRNDPH
jgi:hypothetical protein